MFYIISLLIVLLLFYLRFRKARNIFISAVLPPVEVEDARCGTIQVLTYNVAGLPQRISSADTPRKTSMEIIGRLLNNYDIVNVQEDFNYNSFLFSTAGHPYKTIHKGKVPFGDGLSTLSKFPILEYRRIPWSVCHGSDCLTPKGFSYIRVQLSKTITIDLYNLHANAHDTIRSAQARRHNLNQLAQYIHDHSLERPLLVMGDFNAHYAYGEDNMVDFLKKTALEDVWIGLKREGVFPVVDLEFKAKDMLSLTDMTESLDKVLYRNSTHFKFTPTFYDVDRVRFKDDANLALSDHLAVYANLKWEYQ